MFCDELADATAFFRAPGQLLLLHFVAQLHPLDARVDVGSGENHDYRDDGGLIPFQRSLLVCVTVLPIWSGLPPFEVGGPLFVGNLQEQETARGGTAPQFVVGVGINPIRNLLNSRPDQTFHLVELRYRYPFLPVLPFLGASDAPFSQMG